MPWDKTTFGAVCAGLRDSARKGELVPCIWAKRIEAHDTGGYTFYGCGWGVVGWITAVMLGGTDWATRALSVGCTQGAVNQVLLHAGLSESDVSHMDPVGTWQRFDAELIDAYQNRHQDWDAFIETSTNLAEFFILVLSRVPVDESLEDRHLPYHLLTIPKVEPPLQLAAFAVHKHCQLEHQV